jgi:hypothetical protein
MFPSWEGGKSGINFLGAIPLYGKICTNLDAVVPVIIKQPTSLQTAYYPEITGGIATEISIIRHRINIFLKVVI